MIEVRILLPHGPQIYDRIGEFVARSLAAGGKISCKEVPDVPPPPGHTPDSWDSSLVQADPIEIA